MRFEHLVDVVVAVDGDGCHHGRRAPLARRRGGARRGGGDRRRRSVRRRSLLPGLVDLHVHAPQWPQLGHVPRPAAGAWLFDHTFPLEARYADPAFAAPVWADLVTTLLRHGTTTAVYFADQRRGGDARRWPPSACARASGRSSGGSPWTTPTARRRGTATPTRPAGLAASARLDRRHPRPRRRSRPGPADHHAPVHAVVHRRAAAPGSASSPPRPACAVQTHARSPTGPTGTRSTGSGPPTPRRSTASACCARTPCWPTPSTSPTTTPGASSSGGSGSPTARCRTPTSPTASCPCGACSTAASPSASAPTSPAAPRRACSAQCQHAVTVSRLLEDGVDGGWSRASVACPGHDRHRHGLLDGHRRRCRRRSGCPSGCSSRAVGSTRSSSTPPPSTASVKVWPGLDDPRLVFEKIVRLVDAADITSTWVDGRLVSG